MINYKPAGYGLVLMLLVILTTTSGLEDSWIFTTDSLPMVDGELNLKRMASVGNGHLATVVYSDTIYMNGLYNGPQGWSHRASIRSQHNIRILINNTESSHTYSLNTWKGWFEETITSNAVTIKHRTFAHQHYTQLIVTEIEVTRIVESDNTQPLELQLIRSTVNSTEDVWMDETMNHTDVKLATAPCLKAHGQTLEAESNRSSAQDVYMFWTDIPDYLTFSGSEKHAKWTFFTSIDTNEERAKTVFQSAIFRLSEGKDQLHHQHLDAWTDKWNKGRIDVEGDAELNKMIHSSLYYILSSLPSTKPNQPNEKFYGLSPGGLANGANATDYQGHVFWDMETWMYPPILMFFPDLAKSMLNYRIQGMDAAYDRAAKDGYEGLRYPWESALSGDEMTPVICIPCAENQQHVTADIAFAARQYISATRDVEWLRKDGGYSFIRDMAKFWQSRVTWNQTKDAFEIKGVMGPDEYAKYVSNSVYTNIAAKLAIDFSQYTACLTDLDNIPEIQAEWLEKAKNMYIPFDEDDLYHPEYEGYGTNYYNGSAIVKQADVILLGFPLMYSMPEKVRQNDLDVYEKVTDPKGPAMTWSMFAINLLELGNDEKAAEMFKKSYSGLATEPFNVWTEAIGGVGAVNFITGMGGFLQAVLFGYGGARLHVESLNFDPKLPVNVTSLRFVGLDYLGATFDLYIKENRVIVVVKDTGDFGVYLRLKDAGTEFRLHKGREMSIPRTAFTLYTSDVSDCPLPEESSCPGSISDNGMMATLEFNNTTSSTNTSTTSNTTTDPVQHIIVKQTGGKTCSDHWSCTAREMEIQDKDVSYNYLIGQDGRIYQASGWTLQTNAAFRKSILTIGIIGDFICKSPNDKSMAALSHLLKCGISRGVIDQRYVLLSGRQMIRNSEVPSPHDMLHCSLKTSRHWMDYHYEGKFKEPLCSGECYQPQMNPTSRYQDISDDPTIFKTESLPMTEDGEIDFRYMTSVGNGHLATVVYSDTIYMNGLYNGPPGWSHRARIPSTHAIHVSLPNLNSSDITRQYQLDVKKAIFEERIDTPDAVIKQRTYAHQYYTRLLVTEIEIQRKATGAASDIMLSVMNHPGNDSLDIIFNDAVNHTREDDSRNWSADYWYLEGMTNETESNTTDKQNVYMYWTALPSSLELPASEMKKTWVFVTSIDMQKDAAEESFTKALDLLKQDIHALYISHVDAWRKRWAEGSIVLEGDNYISKRIYGSFYYLLSFLPATDPFIKNNQFFGLSPGGLANGANWTDYQGHVFWDQETWMYPTMLMFHPDLAKEMLSYRIYGMEPAYERAEVTDPPSKGLRYPWESAFTGLEQTPDICIPCRENQQHITGDIALAARQYLSVTKDLKWLKREKGYKFIRDMAEFWATRPVYNEARDSFDVNGVMPPDEHAQSINNSAYTNIGAKLSIYFARYAACLTGLNTTEEVPDSWLEVADKLFLPFNKEKHYHPEFEGYESWTDERGVKQADTIMLGYPQMWPMNKNVRKNDLIHYEKVTNPLGPAMTWGMFSIGWLELGDEHKAHELFHRSYSPYVREPFKIWTEARSGIGAVNFITGMGGFLQAVFFGYGGARIYSEHMEFNPRLPVGNTALKFLGVNYLYNSLDIEIYEHKVIVVLRKASKDHPLFIEVHQTGANLKLFKGKEVVLNREAFSLRSHFMTECSLPKDEVKRGDCAYVVSREKRGSAELCKPQKRTEPADIIDIQPTGQGNCDSYSSCIKLLHNTKTKDKNPVDEMYNFIIGGDGRLYEGLGWKYQLKSETSTSETSSTSKLLIGILGDYRCKKLDEKQFYNLKRLVKCGVESEYIKKDFKINSDESTPRLYYQLMTYRKQPVIRQPDTCDETMPHLQGDTPDTSTEETVFSTDMLPMTKDGEIDFRYMASVGNGHLATTVFSDTIYINGLYNGELGYSHRARIPSLSSLDITVEGATNITRSYSLDVKTGVFTETITTSDVTIRHRIYAHQYYDRLLVTEVLVDRQHEFRQDVAVVIRNRFPANESEDINFGEAEPLKTDLCGNWPCWIRNGHINTSESETSGYPGVYVSWYEIPDHVTLRAAYSSDRWIFLTSIDQTKERSTMNFEAGRRDFLSDKDLVYQKHIQAWNRKWDKGRIEVKGNTQLSKLVYGSFYYLFSSMPAKKSYSPHNQFYGVSPGGLANGAEKKDYQGHVFWDQDTWMFPGILMFHPGMAKTMLSYRLYSMKEAYKRATSGGREGLQFPWEAAYTGGEVTPDICIPCRENQQHITGDIAFAARQYLSATRDERWLKNEMGYEFIRDMAKFWVSRAKEDYDSDMDRYNINGVMPPDEYQRKINNSVYTNIGAKLSIMFADYAACVAGESGTESMEQWLDVARKIFVPFNKDDQFHPEFEGFEDVTGERRIIKQADAILTGFPQMWPMSEDVRRNDLELYEKITTAGGPAMTWGMFAIGWLELGDETKAKEFFHKSYSPFVREPFKVWTEAQSGIGAVNFLTGMGGFLQTVLFGYGGARLHVEKLEFNPRIIPGTSGMRFVDLDYLGNAFNIDVYTDTVKIALTRTSDRVLQLTTSDQKLKLILEKGREYKLKKQGFTIETLNVMECPLTEELGSSCPQIVPRSWWEQKDAWVTIEKTVLNISEVVISQLPAEDCTNYKDCTHHLQAMKAIHMKDESGIPFNFLIDRSGNVYEGSGWHGNSYRLVIGMFGDYTCRKLSLSVEAATKNLLKCGVEKHILTKEYIVITERQLMKQGCNDPICYGEHLLCSIKQWKHWKNVQYGGKFREPNCNGPCIKPVKQDHNSFYRDISLDPFIFQTKRLPRKQIAAQEYITDYRYMTSVGNGHLATVVYSDTIYMNGLYNGLTGYSHRARIPATQALYLTNPNIQNRLYSLNVKKGIFEETFDIGDIKVVHRTYAHQYYTRLLVTEVILSRDEVGGAPVYIDVRKNNGGPSEDIDFSDPREYINSKYRYSYGETKVAELSDGKTQAVHVYSTTVPLQLELPAKKTTQHYIFITSIDIEDWAAKNTFNEALRIIDVHPENLYNSHVTQWHQKWHNGRIDVDGNLELSKYINSCFYYLMSSLPSQHTFLPNRKFSGLSPGGLANGANATDYQGHVFWDMDTWMFPGMLMFHPELAQEMLAYRINSMEPAYERAKANGQEGLRFPWESARTGHEVTPDICIPCRENQQHVTGDVALAARQYVSATRDLSWLQGKRGYVFIRDMAKYWYTRAEFNTKTGFYDINGVMPPDEYAESVNNSVYTNVGAKLSINFARYAACLAGEDVEKEVPDAWLHRAKKIALPFDKKKMYHPEYDGYEEDLDARGVKQADVILLPYPQMWPVDKQVRRNDLDYYETVTNHLGPAMTWGMFSIGWLELGEEEKAAELFKRSYSLYTREPFKIWTEAYAGIGAVNFLTGMGGFLQSVVFGYGGARLHTEKLTFDPKLPPHTTGLRFKSLDYLKNSLDIVIKSDHVTVVAKTTSLDNPLVLRVDETGAMFTVKKDKEIMLPRTAFTLRSVSVTDCPLPEEDSCPHVNSRRSWDAVDPKDKELTGLILSRVIIHQTGGEPCLTLDACRKRVKMIQTIHQTSGVDGQVLGDIAYNFLIGADGRVYEGRGWGLGPYHPDINIRLSSLSLAFIGDYTSSHGSDLAIMAAKQLIKCARERGILSKTYELVYESQLSSTPCEERDCIGDGLYCVIQKWKHWSKYQMSGTTRQPNCQDKDGMMTDSHVIDNKMKKNNEQIKPLYTDISDDPYIFSTDRLPLSPSTNNIDYRFMTSVGNGHLATVVYSDTIYMNGFYNGPFGYSHRARIPSNQAVRLSVTGILQHHYALDTQRGVFEETIDSPGVKLIVRTYAHQFYTQLLVLEIEAVRKSDGTEDITIDIQNDYEATSTDLTMSAEETYKQFYRFISATTIETETSETQVSSVFIFRHPVPSTLTLLGSQQQQRWIYFTSIDGDKRKAEAAFNAALNIIQGSPNALLTKHEESWKNSWSKGRVEVGDNIFLSKLINSCFYYLLSFLPASDPFLPNEQFYGLSPGGLANGANATDYQGHVFWDMETWMYPGMLTFRPDLAKAMLSYRIYGMTEAGKRAESGNYEGVRFPWESAYTGAEQTPDICVPCRENQQHVTGDIALAAKQYFSMTRDFNWLTQEKGYEFIREMGKFWKSRPTYNTATQQYDINGVMPPDEHAESVNNSVYTNVGAKISIYYANYVACLLNNTEDDTESWVDVADKIAVLFDSQKKIHPEYDGYYDGDDERGVKQADVILLGYPQLWSMSPEVRKNDLIKYEKVTNPMGPAMTWGMFAIGWLELGEEKKAADLFRRSYDAYNREPFKVWTEARAGIGAVNFLTGMGGFLQAVVNGYGGLRIHPEHIEFDPRVIPDTSYLRFVGLDYLGHSLNIEIRESYVSIVDTEYNSDHPLLVYVLPTKSIVHVQKDEEIRIGRSRFIIISTTITECPLPKGSSSCSTVISRSEWDGVEPTQPTKLSTPVSEVVIYQTSTPQCYNYKHCQQTVHQLETSQVKNGKSSLGYNFVVGSNMRVYEGRGWTQVGDHSSDRNSKSLGIGVIGDFTNENPSKTLLAVLHRLIKCGVENKMIKKDYKLLWKGQIDKPDCIDGLCTGDRLYCQLMNWRHWGRIEGDRIPDCKKLTDEHTTDKPIVVQATVKPVSSSSSLYTSLFVYIILYITYRYII